MGSAFQPVAKVLIHALGPHKVLWKGWLCKPKRKLIRLKTGSSSCL